MQLQVPFDLTCCTLDGRPEDVTTYVADFVYLERARDNWRQIAEDVKGMRAAIYKLERRWVLA